MLSIKKNKTGLNEYSQRLTSWNHNDAGSTIVDSVSGINLSTDSVVIDGLYGARSSKKARNYNGRKSSVSNDTIRDILISNFTVQIVFKASSDTFVLLSCGSSSYDILKISCSSGVLRIKHADTDITTTIQITEGIVYLLCVSYDGDNIIANIFSKDDYDSFIDTSIDPTSVSATLKIGTNISETESCDCIIEDVSISSILTITQIYADAYSILSDIDVDEVSNISSLRQNIRCFIKENTIEEFEVQLLDFDISYDIESAAPKADITILSSISSSINSLLSNKVNSINVSDRVSIYIQYGNTTSRIGLIPLFDGCIATLETYRSEVKASCIDARAFELTNKFITEEQTYINIPAISREAQIQQIINDAGDYIFIDDTALFAEPVTGSMVESFIQQKESVYAAINSLAEQIGCLIISELREFRWRVISKLPDQSSIISSYTLHPRDRKIVQAIDGSSIRNHVTVISTVLDDTVPESEIALIEINSSNIEVTTAVAHGLTEGDKFAVSGTENFNGVYTVGEVLTTTKIKTFETTSSSFADETNGYIEKTDPKGDKIRKSVTVNDTASIANHGERKCVVSEGSTTSLNLLSEIEDFANRILNDLKDPDQVCEISVQLNPFIQIYDICTIPAENTIISDSDLVVSIIGIKHKISDGVFVTEYKCLIEKVRGPRERVIRSSSAELNIPRSSDIVIAPPTPIVSNVERAVVVHIVPFDPSGIGPRRFDAHRRRRIFEVHVGDSAEFECTAGTFRNFTETTQISIQADPHEARYVRIVERDSFGSRSAPSEAIEIKPLFQPTLPVATVGLSADDTISGTETLIEFDTVEFDTTGYYDTASHAYIIPSTAKDAIYRVDCILSIDPADKPDQKSRVICKVIDDDGTTILKTLKGPMFHNSASTDFVELQPFINCVVSLSAGQSIKIFHEGLDDTFNYTVLSDGTRCTFSFVCDI